MPIPGVRAVAAAGRINIINDEGGVFSSTLTGHAIGAAQANRLVVVRVHGWRVGNTDRTLTSATIGGVAATIYKQATCNSSGNCNVVAIIGAIVPTGTTADISLTWSGSMSGNEVQVVALAGLNAPLAAVDTQSSAVDGSVTSLSFNIAKKAGGIVFGLSAGRDGGRTAVWTGLTEEYDNGNGTYNRTFAKARAVDAAALAVQVTYSGSLQRGALVAASLR